MDELATALRPYPRSRLNSRAIKLLRERADEILQHQDLEAGDRAQLVVELYWAAEAVSLHRGGGLIGAEDARSAVRDSRAWTAGSGT